MENDRWLAIDKQATIDGTVCLVRDRDTGEVTGRYAKEAESALRYQPHVRTCSGFRWQR